MALALALACVWRLQKSGQCQGPPAGTDTGWSLSYLWIVLTVKWFVSLFKHTNNSYNRQFLGVFLLIMQHTILLNLLRGTRHIKALTYPLSPVSLIKSLEKKKKVDALNS